MGVLNFHNILSKQVNISTIPISNSKGKELYHETLKFQEFNLKSSFANMLSLHKLRDVLYFQKFNDLGQQKLFLQP